MLAPNVCGTWSKRTHGPTYRMFKYLKVINQSNKLLNKICSSLLPCQRHLNRSGRPSSSLNSLCWHFFTNSELEHGGTEAGPRSMGFSLSTAQVHPSTQRSFPTHVLRRKQLPLMGLLLQVWTVVADMAYPHEDGLIKVGSEFVG